MLPQLTAYSVEIIWNQYQWVVKREISTGFNTVSLKCWVCNLKDVGVILKIFEDTFKSDLSKV